MANEKAKIEQSALKYFQRGQLVKAIGEYQRIVAMDPSDIRIRVKLLDLYARAGLKNDVIEECKRISSTLADQGFILRAIAVWKQALKVVPDDPLVYCSMGELYIKQGLVGDAIAAFKKGVDIYIANKMFVFASDLLRRMEVLAPDNVAIKAHLAELFLEQGDEESFSMQLSRIIDQLKVEGRVKKLASILEGLFARKGRRLDVIIPLIELYLEFGEDQKANEAIRAGMAIAPNDNYLRASLVRVNLALGNIIDARKVALSIHEEEPDNVFILEQLLLIAHARGDEQDIIHWYKELAKASSHLGDSEKEDYYYTKVLELVPDDAQARLAMGAFGPATPDSGGTEADPFAGGEFFLDFGGEEEAAQPSPAKVTEVEESIIEADLYLKYGLDEKALATLTALAAKVPENIPVRVRLRDLYNRMGDQRGRLSQQLAIARLLTDAGKDSEALRAYESVLDIDPASDEARAAVEGLRSGAPPSHGHIGAQLDSELAVIDGLIAAGDSGDAVTALLRLQESHPGSTEVSSRLADLGWVTAFEPMVEEEPDEFEEFKSELGEIDFDISSIAGFEQGEVSELDDILREFKSGMAENLDEEDYDTHYDLGIAYREMGLMEDALQEFQKACVSVDKAKAAFTSMAMVYRELGRLGEARAALKRALEVPTNSEADRASILFEMGSIAEEEEDWREALSSFENVAALDPTHRDVVKRLAHIRSRV